MKGGLCVIYTSLLTISVISSCALFILVVSDALQGEGDANGNVDLSGLHNVSQKVNEVGKDVPDTGQDVSTAGTDGDQVVAEERQRFQDNEMIIAETLSLNSVTTDGLSNISKKRKYENNDSLSYNYFKNGEDVFNDTGHRIIDLERFFSELQKISTHNSLFNCGLSTVKIVSEIRRGLNSEFKLCCEMCKKTFSLKNSWENLNKNAVSGVMVAGCGNAELQNITAALDLPTVSEHLYIKNQNEVCDDWEQTAWDQMKEAGQKEREAALKEGRVTKEGIPLIDVVVDGCWSKRSYRTNYAASSGAAAIIGRRFGQVLFMAVKNKYCCICARDEKTKEPVKEHTCYKNFSGPSTAMEAAIIVEGFKLSIEMHGIIFNRFIADGDCSTYAKILEARPYSNITVEKINCKNHILRNFCNKLQLLKTDTRYKLDERKQLTNEKILSARKYIVDCIKYYNTSMTAANKTENIKLLHNDIILCLRHAFRQHDHCNKTICSKETQTNENFLNSSLGQKMKLFVINVASHARSLIENVDSNIVECFNSVIAKFVGGKRVNYSRRRSYQARCAGAVISFNSGKILSTVQKYIYNNQSGAILRNYEEKKQKKRERNKKSKRKTKHYTQNATLKKDLNYGEHADSPDLDPQTFEEKKASFLKNLEKTEEERNDIEKRTTLQSQSGEWMEVRRNLLTASNFGKIVKRKVNNSCKNIVKNLLYKANIDHVSSIAHGKTNEQTALNQLAVQLNVEIDKCGLFIDEQHPFLGATPDGVITAEDMLVEIKCPIAPYKIGIETAIKEGKMHFWRLNKNTGEVYINKKSDWYFQVQGQMHIAKKEKCLLAVWYGDNKIKSELIQKDDQFWNTVMEPKLVKFYFDCLLPELVDPRFTRNRPIRDPPYVKKQSDKENVPI